MNESSHPPLATMATHMPSPCGTYAFRCRYTCFKNCTGGPECTGERIYLVGRAPVPSPAPAPTVPSPAVWSALQSHTAEAVSKL